MEPAEKKQKSDQEEEKGEENINIILSLTKWNTDESTTYFVLSQTTAIQLDIMTKILEFTKILEKPKLINLTSRHFQQAIELKEAFENHGTKLDFETLTKTQKDISVCIELDV